MCHYTVGMSEKFSDVVWLMTVPELKFMLRELRLAVSGNKETLKIFNEFNPIEVLHGSNHIT